MGEEPNDVASKIEQTERLLENAYRKEEYKKAVGLTKQLLKLHEEDGFSDAKSYSQTLHNMGLVLEKNLDYAEAVEYYQLAADKKKLLHKDSRSYADTLNNLGVVYYKMEAWAEGIAVHKDVLRLREIRLGTYHLDTLHSSYHIGKGYKGMGQYEEALLYLERAFESFQKLQDISFLELAEVKGAIGNCYDEIGNYKKAISAYEETVEFIEKDKSENTLFFAYYMWQLSHVLEKSGYLEMSLDWKVKCISAKHKLYGGDTLDLITSLHEAAKLAYMIGLQNDALVFYKNTIEMVERLFGVEHMLYGEVLNDMAMVYSAMNQHPRAMAYAQKSLEQKSMYAANAFEEKAKSFINIGLILEHMGDPYQGILWIEQGIDLLSLHDLKNTETYINLLAMVSSVYANMGAYVGGIAYLMEAVSVVEHGEFPDASEQLMTLYTQLSILYMRERNYESAIDVLKQMEILSKEVYGDQHPLYAGVLKKMAMVYEQSGDFLSAQKKLEVCLLIEEETIDEDSPKYQQTLDFLGGTYYQAQSYKKAIEIMKKRNDLNFEETPKEQNQAATILLQIALCYFFEGEKKKSRSYEAEALRKQKNSGEPQSTEFVGLCKIFEVVKAGGEVKRPHEKTVISKKERQACIKAAAHLEAQWKVLEEKKESASPLKKLVVGLSLGGLYMKIGDKERAFRWYLVGEKESLYTHYSLASVLLSSCAIVIGNYPMAIRVLMSHKAFLEEYNVQNREVYCRNLYMLGQAYKGLSRTEEACLYFQSWKKRYGEGEYPIYMKHEQRMEKIATWLFAEKEFNLALEYYMSLMLIIKGTRGSQVRYLNYLLKAVHLLLLLGNKVKAYSFLLQAVDTVRDMEQRKPMQHTAYDKIGRLYVMAGALQEGCEILKIAYRRSFHYKKAISREGYIALLKTLRSLEEYELYELVRTGKRV